MDLNVKKPAHPARFEELIHIKQVSAPHLALENHLQLPECKQLINCHVTG